MSQKPDKNDIKNAISSLLEGIEKEKEEKFAKIVEKLMSNTYLHDPENFDILFVYDLKTTLTCYFRKQGYLKNKEYRATEIFMNYQFFSNNIESLIESKEARSCVCDKSRWLITQYLQFLKTGKYPNMTIEEKCYWKPRFGTGKDWMEFIDSLVTLYYGKPQQYLENMKKLIGDNSKGEI